MDDIRAGGQAVSHLDTHAHVQAKREELADDVRRRGETRVTIEPFYHQGSAGKFFGTVTREVALHDVTDVNDLVTVFSLKQLRCSETGDCTVVSSELPRGAFDNETPPDWPPVRRGRRSSLFPRLETVSLGFQRSVSPFGRGIGGSAKEVER